MTRRSFIPAKEIERVLQLRAEGRSIRQIGAALGIDPRRARRIIARHSPVDVAVVIGVDGKRRKAQMRSRERHALHPPRVYFVQAINGGPIKVGCTRNVTTRLAELQTGNPYKLRVLATMPGGAKEEAVLHQSFAVYRLEGEWFQPAPEILDFINGIKEEA